jgi:two-component system response regulator HydG
LQLQSVHPHEESEDAVWLKSPVSAKAERLVPMRELFLEPYYGRKRKIKLFRTHYLIGSGADCGIPIDDPFVSKKHAELRLCGATGGYKITDLGSRNGVFLNGVKIEAAPLQSRGMLRLGRSTLSWKMDEASGSCSDGWVIEDPSMREIVDRVKQIARTGIPVLLLGETGTGKEIMAQLLHKESGRSGEAYVTVNGALTGGSLAESELFGHCRGAFTGADSHRLGALRSAHGGTLFLDEVADIPVSAQIKLLRALESGEVKALGSDRCDRADFRLVSATSQDMERKISDGGFRLDLYYRIAGIVIHIPPLRERPLDILAISKKYLEAGGWMLDREAEGKLLSYRWPGNVRELRSCLGRAGAMAHAEGMMTILPRHLQGLTGEWAGRKRSFGGKRLEEVERDHILETLERNGWSRLSSARELGIARSTLFEKMKKYSLRDAVVKPIG